MWSSRSQDAGGCRCARTLPAGAHSDVEEDDDDELAAGVDDELLVDDDESDELLDEPPPESDDVEVADEPADFEDEPEPRLSVL